jgi:hypothetical protein
MKGWLHTKAKESRKKTGVGYIKTQRRFAQKEKGWLHTKAK